MWISRKTAEIDDAGSFGSRVGVVSVGGKRPAVVTDGESRSAELLSVGGAVYVPRAGDEALLERTGDEERIILGVLPKSLPENLAAGEIYIGVGGGAIHIKANGDIELSGRIRITGETSVDGVLLVNGRPV